MQLPLPIEEQERIVKGYEAMYNAMEKVIKAQKDLDMFPGAFNYKKKLQDAIREMKKVGTAERQYLTTNKNTLFNGTTN